MVKGKLILISQCGGEFVKNDDGTLSYDGGEANAININNETLFDDLKLKIAEMYNLDLATITVKYFLPGNRRNLIMLKNDKDLKRLLDFHGNSVTADVFISGKQGFVRPAAHIGSTGGLGVKVAESVDNLRPSPPTAVDGGTPVMVSDTLVDVNVIMESPGQTTSTSTPSSADDGEADGDSDYAPQRHVSVADDTGHIHVNFNVGSTPADTVKKRRRNAASKVGGKVTVITSDADDDIQEANRSRKKNGRGRKVVLVDDEETGLKGVPISEDFDSSYTLVIPDQDLPENLVASWRDGITGVGQDFESVKEFRDVLQKYAIAHRFVYRLKKNDTNRASGVCVGEGCPWRIHASWVPASQSFRIKKFDNQHTCGGEAWKSAHPGRNWLVSIIKERLRESPHHKPKDIANGILRDFGIELNYTQVWRGLEHAREQLQGSYKDSYNQLPSFCEKVMETNPGSFAKLITKDDKRFQCLFVSFHGLIHGFLNGCRPICFLGSTLLRSKYQEILLTATAIDADDGFFPVAFAIVDVENNDNWRWFLEQLKSALSTSQPITFVSDKDKNLKSCVLEVFDNAYHGYSMFHLVESFRRSLRGPFNCADGRGVLPGILLDAARAVRLGGYQKIMEQIKHISSQAYDWIIQVEPEGWTSLLFQGEPYNHIVENVSETYAKLMEEVQEAAIMQKIEALVHMITDLVENRQTRSNTWSTKLTPSIEKKLQEAMLKARRLKVLFSSDVLAEVHDDCVHVVNIENKECTCLEWKENGLPCRHALAVLNSKGKHIYDYCPKHYTVERYRSTYSVSVNPIPAISQPEEKEETAGDDEDSAEVLPPDPPKLTTQEKREIARMEALALNRRTVTCTRCKEPGHNKASCKATL
ncbi:OLC1v1011957C1 [Oldenlandia corymbosa var. corymbosa]|uniref:OLC1v1011957C1 n=1 Tax=Oldenlandia corymbosa var. corymbosa TaxID=529605 RepID=A0AAV1DYB4_OLDCO|nr:OLC1v1011957C1 [Oldenlandia corymbosa var. corymbosa]